MPRHYETPGNAWAIFAGYLNAVAQQAADPVVAGCLGTPAAADVFTEDNAFGPLESIANRHRPARLLRHPSLTDTLDAGEESVAVVPREPTSQ
ncbi:hypothetical protein [Streptosporangium sp. KLBMP 9127]|nr:hypothetical protein [Streptosporangium sp. KLBMP 9127]